MPASTNKQGHRQQVRFADEVDDEYWFPWDPLWELVLNDHDDDEEEELMAYNKRHQNSNKHRIGRLPNLTNSQNIDTDITQQAYLPSYQPYNFSRNHGYYNSHAKSRFDDKQQLPSFSDIFMDHIHDISDDDDDFTITSPLNLLMLTEQTRAEANVLSSKGWLDWKRRNGKVSKDAVPAQRASSSVHSTAVTSQYQEREERDDTSDSSKQRLLGKLNCFSPKAKNSDLRQIGDDNYAAAAAAAAACPLHSCMADPSHTKALTLSRRLRITR
jgi:hypothetical protein